MKLHWSGYRSEVFTMYLEELLNKNILEDDKIECKQSLNRIDVLDWLKTIAGFSN